MVIFKEFHSTPGMVMVGWSPVVEHLGWFEYSMVSSPSTQVLPSSETLWWVVSTPALLESMVFLEPLMAKLSPRKT